MGITSDLLPILRKEEECYKVSKDLESRMFQMANRCTDLGLRTHLGQLREMNLGPTLVCSPPYPNAQHSALCIIAAQ